MGIGLKHDIRINLKHEKEIFRLVRFLIFETIFSWFFYGIGNYIWDMTWYRIMVFLAPWCAAVPAIVNLFVRKINVRDILGEHVVWQFFAGCGLAVLAALVMNAVALLSGYTVIPNSCNLTVWNVLSEFLCCMCVIGPTEELIYRVAIMGSLREICDRHRWLAPLIANTLFAVSHLMYRDVIVAVFAFLYGAVYTIMAYRWKRCGWVLLSSMHGMYDFSASMLPYLLFYILK